jgi:phosphoribosyl 1,2-cyclic phosphodiesterase
MSTTSAIQLSLFAGHTTTPATPRAPLATPGRRVTGVSAGPTVRFCVLGSGSGGNCSVLHTPGGVMFIDAGLGPATTARRLEQAGLTLADIRAVCLTHLDQDHFRPRWLTRLTDLGVPVWLHRWHATRLHRTPDARPLLDADLLRVFDEDAFSPLDGVTAAPIRFQHDQQGTSGFRLSAAGVSIGYATDLGHVPPAMIDHFAGIDLLAIESNYDPMMQMSSTRPFFLKRRIMSGSGHLSNQQAHEAVHALASRCPHGGPRHIVLLHRSRDCNHPGKIRRLYADHPTLARRLVLTEQRRRSRWIGVRPPARPARAMGTLYHA